MRTVFYTSILLLIALGFRVSTSLEWQNAIGGAVVGLVKPLLVPLVLLIAVPAFVYVVSTLLLLAAFIACATYWVAAVRPRLRQLKIVSQEITVVPLPVIGDGQVRWTEAAQQLGALLRANTIYVSAWSEFQSQATQSGGIPATPFSHFVASEPKDRERDSLMLSLPGYFTSLGLIFTFVGLVVALYFAAKGFRSENIEDARAAIIQLLNAASFKFLTSVAALISAMIVSLFLRFAQSALSQRLFAVAEQIEAFVSVWREEVGARLSGETESADLRRRFTSLLDEIQNLTQAIEGLVRREEARLTESAHAAS